MFGIVERIEKITEFIPIIAIIPKELNAGVSLEIFVEPSRFNRCFAKTPNAMIIILASTILPAAHVLGTK